MLKTWVVNMSWNPQRLAFMHGQLDPLGIAFERFEGIVGADFRGRELRKVFRPLRSLIALRKRMTPQQLGDTLSHNAIYHKMVERNVPAALIFEDDSIVDPRAPEVLAEIERTMDPVKPQVYVLNTWGVDVSGLPPGINRVRNAWCTDGYVITLAGAKLMLAKNEPVIGVCDSWKRFVRWWGLELNVVVPPVVSQANDVFPSDIPMEKKLNNWFVRQFLWFLDFILIKTTGR